MINKKEVSFKDLINDVKDFHNLFGVGNHKTPVNIDLNEVQLRCELLNEELEEYEEAAMKGDLVETVDALADQLYILLGTILRHGMQDVIVDAFKEVHRSNLSKLDKEGKPIINGKNGNDPNKPLGKILKSENYSKPDFSKILKEWL